MTRMNVQIDMSEDSPVLRRSIISALLMLKGVSGVVTDPVTAPEPPPAVPVIRSCNRHLDCDAADRAAQERGASRASHCHDDCCEECFGN